MNLDKISKIYNTANEEILVLDNITYKFEEGKFYAIMGHSGSGKSTLIDILGLNLDFTSGKYYLEGKNINQYDENNLADLKRDYFGFIFQDFYLDKHLKAYENVMLPMIINPKIKDKKEKSLELLKLMGLEHRINHYPKELSGGEKQRISIARALANNPKIILADEPTGNLDESNERQIFTELKKLSEQGKCVVVVSHSNNVKKYADKVLNIKEGKLVEIK